MPLPWLTGHGLIWRSPSPSLSALKTLFKRSNTWQKTIKISQSLPLPCPWAWSWRLHPHRPQCQQSRLAPATSPSAHGDQSRSWWPGADPAEIYHRQPAPGSPSSWISSWHQPSKTNAYHCDIVIETQNSDSQWCDNRQSETLNSDRDTQLCDNWQSDIE